MANYTPNLNLKKPLTTEKYDVVADLNDTKDKIDTHAGTVNAQLNDMTQDFSAQLAEKVDKGNVSVSDINKNLGKLDQSFMSEEFLQQMAGTTPINAVPTDKSITTSKLAYTPVIGKKSKNLFNKDTVTNGFFIDYTTGDLSDAADYAASDFIEVLPSTDYYKNIWSQFAFYDANKVYLGGLANAVYTFTTPSDVKYIRLSLNLNRDEVNIGQLERGSVGTGYESFDDKIDPKTILDKSIEEKHLNFIPLIGVKSKNLFDKTKATLGQYVSEDTGNLLANPEFFTSEKIAVSPSTTYAIDYNRVAFYDVSGRFISGIVRTVGSGVSFVTPPNCYYIRTSALLLQIDTFQIEQNDTLTSYETFEPKLNINSLPSADAVSYKNLITVAKTGANYSTITDAINAISDDGINNEYTILLAPGTYVESVKLLGRYISIVGYNTETCIIKTFTNDYYNPPVDLCVNSHLYNLTIIADENETTPKDGVNNLPSYGIHFDIASREGSKPLGSIQGVSRVKNCVIISKNQHAAGIGLANKQHLIFEDCEFISFENSAFRAHNDIRVGSFEQKMTVRNCVFHNNGTFEPIVLQDPNNVSGGMDNVDTIFTFQNNIAYSETNGQKNALSVHTPLVEGAISGKILLGKGSFGNSIPELNA